MSHQCGGKKMTNQIGRPNKYDEGSYVTTVYIPYRYRAKIVNMKSRGVSLSKYLTMKLEEDYESGRI